MLRVSRMVLIASSVVVLAGCSAGSGYADLDRAATSADVLPADLPGYASEDMVDDSVRFVGEHDGVEYFLGRWDEMPGACLVVYRSAEGWIGGCGTAGGTFAIGGMGLNVSVVTDGTPAPEGGTPVGTNIVVR